MKPKRPKPPSGIDQQLLQAEAQRLIAAGKMPTLAELLEAIENTRSKYRAAGYKVSTGYPLRDMKRRGRYRL